MINLVKRRQEKLFSKKILLLNAVCEFNQFIKHNSPEIIEYILIKDKSVASFCHQVAAWVPDLFRNFYLVNNHTNENNSTTTIATEKVTADLESLQF